MLPWDQCSPPATATHSLCARGKGNGIKHQAGNAAAAALKARPGAGSAAPTAGWAPPALQSLSGCCQRCSPHRRSWKAGNNGSGLDENVIFELNFGI